MPLLRDSSSTTKGSSDASGSLHSPLVPAPAPSRSTTADTLMTAGTQPTTGTVTRSQATTQLSCELRLRVQAQEELVHTIEDILNQAYEAESDITHAELNVLDAQVDEYHNAFRQEHARLVANWPPSHLDHHYFTRKVSVSESKAVVKVKRMLGRLKKQISQAAQPPPTAQSATQARSRLPEITVPIFSGTSRLWPDFKAMFNSVIGNRSDISELEKFQYLKAAIKGEPAEIIVNLTPDSSSYKTAWERLDARYENKRVIINSHLDRLLKLKPMQRRQASSLTKLVNIVNELKQAVRTLTTEDSGDCVMVAIARSLLDEDTRERWESSLSETNEFPSLSQLNDFLLARARTLEAIQTTGVVAPGSSTKGAVSKRITSHQTSQQQQQPTSGRTRSAASPPARAGTQPFHHRAAYPCDCCEQDHFVVMCPRFRGFSSAQRVRLVRERSLCCNCLGRHNARKCNNPRHCKTCNDTHHTMLHGADLAPIFGTWTSTSQETAAASTSSE